VKNLIFGLFESAGWVSRERTGAVQAGFITASEQLAYQIHWLLLRFGITSTVRRCQTAREQPGETLGRQVRAGQRGYTVRVAGIDDVVAFVEAIPMWGPRGYLLATVAARSAAGRRRRSQDAYLPHDITTPVLGYPDRRGLTAREAALAIGPSAGNPQGGSLKVFGSSRLQRDRLEVLDDRLGDEYVHQVPAEEVRYSMIREVLPPRRARTFDLEVEELQTFVAEDVVVHNCAPPFRQAEFDILYGKGISREGSLIDLGVEQGILRKSGAWYTYKDDQLGQGKENARAFLSSNSELADEIEKLLKEKLDVHPKLDTDVASEH
jgi:intein/homing endonuclease